ncbi:ABC transporter permease [Jatrophihabitans endophyticus]|uniref:ABC transporter permease n=1 Tax=Jatrophihabitans endophyticus TaxID=1206085 RepID=UPI0019F1FC4D|nr:ABC transporter permease [Jatrophihabitans endophyticus]MBE7190732.1 ABC transporter permease [Jatrophihabitans endophyticus]
MLDVISIPAEPPREIRARARADIIGSLRELWRRRELIRVLTTRDFIARYKQTFLGVGWSVLAPLAIVLALSLFLRRFTNPRTGGAPYELWTFTGLIPWSFFSGALSAGVVCLLANQPLLNKVRCPREVFPFAAVALTAIDTLISVLTLSVMFAVTTTLPSSTAYWVPVIALAQVPAVFGIAVLGAIVVVYLRDLRNIVPLILQFGLFVTPIAFGLEQVPSRWRLLYCFANPVAPIIDSYRRVLLLDQAPQWRLLGAGAISGVVLFVVAMKAFRKYERGIADLI